jgi:hypothetical protein
VVVGEQLLADLGLSFGAAELYCPLVMFGLGLLPEHGLVEELSTFEEGTE